MYLSRSRTGNIFPSWTVVVRRHHVYVREFHLPSCNSAVSKFRDFGVYSMNKKGTRQKSPETRVNAAPQYLLKPLFLRKNRL